MKFGCDVDGKLIQIERLELDAQIAKLEAKLDNRNPAERAEDVPRLRAVLVDAGQSLSAEDENILTLYKEGVIDFHNVEHHFGQRLVEALLRLHPGGRDAA